MSVRHNVLQWISFYSKRRYSRKHMLKVGSLSMGIIGHIIFMKEWNWRRKNLKNGLKDKIFKWLEENVNIRPVAKNTLINYVLLLKNKALIQSPMLSTHLSLLEIMNSDVGISLRKRLRRLSFKCIWTKRLTWIVCLVPFIKILGYYLQRYVRVFFNFLNHQSIYQSN